MKTVGKIFLALVLSCCPAVAWATPQAPDKLIYNGQEYFLHANPLEQYFERHPDSRPNTEFVSTALWRGYIATFEIIEGRLYVRDVEIPGSGWDFVSAMKTVFPDSAAPVPMEWYTGLLVLPHGEMVNYVHMGYASEYSDYLVIEITGGLVTKTENFDLEQYRDFRERQFQAFRKTKEYRDIVQTIIESSDTVTDEFIEDFMRVFAIEHLSQILD